MTPRLTLRPVNTVPRTAEVRDYDQLSPMAKQTLSEAAHEYTTIAVSSSIATCFEHGEIINYTDYLRIDR